MGVVPMWTVETQSSVTAQVMYHFAKSSRVVEWAQIYKRMVAVSTAFKLHIGKEGAEVVLIQEPWIADSRVRGLKTFFIYAFWS